MPDVPVYKRRRIRRRPQASKGGVSDQSPKLANNNGSNDQLVALYRLVLLVPRETPKKAKMKKARRRPGFRSASRPYIPLGPRRMPWDDSFELLGGGLYAAKLLRYENFKVPITNVIGLFTVSRALTNRVSGVWRYWCGVR